MGRFAARQPEAAGSLRLLIATLLSTASLLAGSPAQGQSDGERVPNELLVKFLRGQMPGPSGDRLASAGVLEVRPLLSQEMLRSWADREAAGLDRAHVEAVFDHPMTQWAHVILAPGTDDAAATAAIVEDDAVEDVLPNVYGELHQTVPNDPQFGQQWGLLNTGQTNGTTDADIDAELAWDLQTGSPAVVVAISDTGINYNHPDLAPNMWRNPGEIAGNGIVDDGNGIVDDVFGANYAGSTPTGNPNDTIGHGTHVAGIVGAVGNNGTGVAGTAWTVRLMAVKFIDGSSPTCAGAINTINYATLMGAHVINGSWRLPCGEALRNAIALAGQQNILFVTSAGNSGANNDITSNEPATFRLMNLIAVAATDHHDQRAIFTSSQSSNYGSSRVQIAAPGKSIRSTFLSTNYATLSGTSQASPLVAGVAALVIARHPGIAVDDLKTALVLGGDQLASLDGLVVQGRRLNARGALIVSDTWVGSSVNAWECDDGVDNDGDGLVDFPDDPDCTYVFPDGSESSGCGGGFAAALLLPLFLPLHHGVRRLRSQAQRSR
jgi:subtilisin family serine protease